MDWETVLRELCCAAGVGGQNEAAQVAAGYLRDYCDEVTVDALGNVLASAAADRNRLRRFCWKRISMRWATWSPEWIPTASSG